MILGKFWSAIRAQINKIANVFWEADPIAQMQYEHDMAVEQLKEGRKGLEMYRGLVERVTRQASRHQVARAEARSRDQGVPQGRRARNRRQIRARAAKGQEGAGSARGTAPDARDRLREQPQEDQARQRQAGEVRERIQKYDAELKMSAAEAEVAALAESFDLNITTDFGQLEQVIQSKIDKNRARRAWRPIFRPRG